MKLSRKHGRLSSISLADANLPRVILHGQTLLGEYLKACVPVGSTSVFVSAVPRIQLLSAHCVYKVQERSLFVSECSKSFYKIGTFCGLRFWL